MGLGGKQKKSCLAVFHGWQNVFTQLNDVRHTQGNATNDENGTVEEEVDDEQGCCWSKRERERGEINDRFERGNSTCKKERKKKYVFVALFLKVCQSGEYFKDGGRVIGALITATGEP